MPSAVAIPGPCVRKNSAPRMTRCLDFVAASALLLGALPILTLAALIIARLSGRSPFVAHLRVGQFGRPLWMIKLRSMWDEPGGPGLVERVGAGAPESKEVGDRRVRSAFARWCRRYSIDELPQLIHVLCGEMSMVGPRPITRSELDRYYGNDAAEVLVLRPGITGLWQSMGRNRRTYAQRRRLDLFLVRRYSLRLYLMIFWRTIPRALSGNGAW